MGWAELGKGGIRWDEMGKDVRWDGLGWAELGKGGIDGMRWDGTSQLHASLQDILTT